MRINFVAVIFTHEWGIERDTWFVFPSLQNDKDN